jgi:hypothetical protein
MTLSWKVTRGYILEHPSSVAATFVLNDFLIMAVSLIALHDSRHEDAQAILILMQRRD